MVNISVRRGFTRGATVVLAGTALAACLMTAPAGAADFRSATVSQASNEDPEIVDAETTDLVPTGAKVGDILRVRDFATGQMDTYRVINTIDLGAFGQSVLKGAITGAAGAEASLRIFGSEGSAGAAKLPAAVVGGTVGGIVGGVGGLYDIIFKPELGISLVKGDVVFFEPSTTVIFDVPGQFVDNVGVVPLDAFPH
ncbi:hypothetical protein ACFWN1_18670 [Streptomyces sp. NPDC058459]|uniref:hypothetical protein n=1 Tax=Streptomyces sp. NPDC058459 TaxID=3346508 RepID=UPI003657E1F5